jgi:phytoene dehydrogenase-like protein
MNTLKNQYDAVVVGSGPNGLAAAITVAQAGRSVLVIEGKETIGGGTRTEELTLPGFLHDVCSSVFPMALLSPFFRSLPLKEHRLEWIQPEIPLAHPLDDGTAVIADRSVDVTAENLGEDADAYRELMRPIVEDWGKLEPLLLGYGRIPKNPFAASRFGWHALHSASKAARRLFKGERARALFAGNAAHSILPLEQMPTAAFGLVFAASEHVAGWPFARGGAKTIAEALASYLRSLDGEIVTGRMVTSLDELPSSRVVLCDVTPKQVANIAGGRLPESFRAKLGRFQYGPGVCKVDWALDGPIPWRAEACKRAGTVHVGGTLEEIEASERAAWSGQICERPFVLMAQASLFDNTRAPAGKHTGWAYCHVPNGSSADMSDRIESQIERFAPGFRQRILKRSVLTASQLEARNPNLIGGDITGGAATLRQLFFRPTARMYRTPAQGLYLCSASTPPGGGVHGICGHLAARVALTELR